MFSSGSCLKLVAHAKIIHKCGDIMISLYNYVKQWTKIRVYNIQIIEIRLDCWNLIQTSSVFVFLNFVIQVSIVLPTHCQFGFKILRSIFCYCKTFYPLAFQLDISILRFLFEDAGSTTYYVRDIQTYGHGSRNDLHNQCQKQLIVYIPEYSIK